MHILYTCQLVIYKTVVAEELELVGDEVIVCVAEKTCNGILPSDEPVAASAPLPSDASEVSAPAPLPAPTPSNPTWEDRKAQGSALVEKGKEHAKNAGNMLSGFTESVGNGVRNVGSSITGFFSRSTQSGGTTDVNDLPNADSYGTPDSFVSSEQSGGRKYRRKIRKSRRKARKSRRKARKSRRRK